MEDPFPSMVEDADLTPAEVSMVVHGIEYSYCGPLDPIRKTNGDRRSTLLLDLKPQHIVYIVEVKNKSGNPKWVYTEKCERANCLENGQPWQPGLTNITSCEAYEKFGMDSIFFRSLKNKARKKGLGLYPFMNPENQKVIAFLLLP